MEYNHKTTKHFLEKNLPFQLESFDDESISSEELNFDLNNIDDDYANSLSECKPGNWRVLVSLSKDDEFLTWKKYILLKKIEKEVKPIFVNTLEKYNISYGVKPYDEPDLKDLDVDKDCLVNLSEFLEYSKVHDIEHKYSICLPIRDPLLYERILLSFLNFSDKSQIKIRLDPLFRYPEFTSHFVRLYGKTLKWDELAEIQDEFHADCQDFETGIKTQILWKKMDDNTLQFFCEELPLYEQIKERGSRFYHAIYNIETEKITHFDASTIIYTETEFIKRNSLKLWDLDRHMGKYYKIYRIDGDVDRNIFSSMVTSYFVRNEDVLNHFKDLCPKKKDD